MIDRELRNLVAADQVRPAIADAGQVQFRAPPPQGEDHGRPHVLEIAVERAHGHDFFVGLDDGSLAMIAFDVVGAAGRGQRVAQFARDDFDGALAGDLAGRWPPMPSATMQTVISGNCLTSMASSLFSR